MKGLVKFKKGSDGIEVREIEKPSPHQDELLIKIHAGGICGTDIHIRHDEYEAYCPVVMGHEYSGIVEEVGSEVRDFKPGDRVISLTAAATCGKCEFCRKGLYMLCDERRSIGSGVNGSFAEYMVIPARLAFIIPDNISMDEAALSEPLACVVRAVIEISAIKSGDFVYVAGPGTMGQLTAQVAKSCGAHITIGGTDADIERLAIAKELGADELINVQQENVLNRMKEITGGVGYDVAYECSGAAPSAQTCLEVLRKTGQYSQVGLFGKPILFDHDLALKKEVHIVNSFAQEPTSWEIMLRLMARDMIKLDKLISGKFSIDNWEEAFDKVERKEGFKILLTVNES